MDFRNTSRTLIFNVPKKNKKWIFGGMRQIDFVHNNIRIRLGQAYTLLVGNISDSMSHLAFPLGAGVTVCNGSKNIQGGESNII